MIPLQNILQGNYNTGNSPYQIKLPIELGIKIEDNDPVRLLDSFVDTMDLTELCNSYGRRVKKTADPVKLFKIVVFGMMKKIYSARGLQEACRKNIDFMFLLDGSPVPDHATFARFVSEHFSKCSEKTMSKMTFLLKELGEISGETIFIDGTKIEAYANKYTFVWKKAVSKNVEKMGEKISAFVNNCVKEFDIQVVSGTDLSLRFLKKIRKKLYAIKHERKIKFVHGIGKKKSKLQKAVEELEAYIQRTKKYIIEKNICGDRNSYSKTDHDATFMRLKEDAMRNGQLKPAYNVQHGVDSEYIVWADVSAHPTDTLTLIPFLRKAEEMLGYKYKNIVADAGYESEENYVFIESNGQDAYIKPANYEISKTKKYRTDIGKFENMTYDPSRDTYICRNGKELKSTGVRKRKSGSGYVSESTLYTCSDCKGCPFKTKCIKGNNCDTPMDERSKTLNISKKKEELRKKNLERILSDHGTLFRINRSIQAEGSFAIVKEDMDFRQYSYRGKASALAQTILIAFAYNFNKLHHKIQSKRTGSHLFEVLTSA